MKQIVIATMPMEVYEKIPINIRDDFTRTLIDRDDEDDFKGDEDYIRLSKAKSKANKAFRKYKYDKRHNR
jgi:hypothetical protein